MLNLSVLIGILLWECVARSEVEVTYCNLVVSELAIYHLALVKNLKLEESALCQVTSATLKPYVKGSRGVIRPNKDLFLEDDSILPRNILVAILKGLYLLNFLEV
jgi:hypothetical protein